jgi:hypothetical protein
LPPFVKNSAKPCVPYWPSTTVPAATGGDDTIFDHGTQLGESMFW